MENSLRKQLREDVSKILIKWGMGTRQVAIIEIVKLIERVPCCGHNCCCNKVLEGGVRAMAKDKSPKKEVKKAKKGKKK